MPTPRKISEFKPLVGNLAQSSHYEVTFGGLSSELLSYLNSRGVNRRFIAENAGLLCSSASLPGSSLATSDIMGNFMGVQEQMAHTRIYTDIGLEFYVDSDYRMLKFLEHWMEFISGGSEVSINRRDYFYRMRYPSTYKCDSTKIVKFDNDFGKEIEYNFYGMFPKNLTSIPVAYGPSQILKVNASFVYERYIPGKINSISKIGGTDNNKR